MSDDRLILTEDDFNEPDVAPAHPQGVGGQTQGGSVTGPALPSVNSAPASQISFQKSTASAPGVLFDPRFGPVFAAVLGMTVGWGITEIFGIVGNGDSQSSYEMWVAIWTGIIGVFFGCSVLFWDRIVARDWESIGAGAIRALAPLALAGMLSGYLASKLYASILGDTNSTGTYFFARGLAWGLFGALLGVAIGLASRSQKRGLNGGVGGAIGGVIGGVMFEWQVDHANVNVVLSRLLGLVVIGVLIAVATRLVETARKTAWLHVIQGGMTGKEFILYHATTRIGAAPDCEIFIVKDPSVVKYHASIQDDGSSRILTPSPQGSVLVNQQQVTSACRLSSGDRIHVGNTILQYAER